MLSAPNALFCRSLKYVLGWSIRLFLNAKLFQHRVNFISNTKLSFVVLKIQSISVIRPAFLEGENGPYKQIGPVSSTHIQCLQIEKLT